MCNNPKKIPAKRFNLSAGAHTNTIKLYQLQGNEAERKSCVNRKKRFLFKSNNFLMTN
jgi:hypothetical protein